MLGHVAFWGFLAVWNPTGSSSPFASNSIPSSRAVRRRRRPAGLLGRDSAGRGCSSIASVGFERKPITIRIIDAPCVLECGWRCSLDSGRWGRSFYLWFYQWRSFGHPFYPGQHWMPPVEWIELGYQGFTWASTGLTVDAGFRLPLWPVRKLPIMLLALAAPFVIRGRGGGWKNLNWPSCWACL